MAQVRDYAKLARDIMESVGEENITSAAHCATRLRLVLKQTPSAEVTAKISGMPAVIQVVEKGGQYQIVIGTHAKDVYEELTRIIHLDENQDTGQKGSILSRIIATMSAVFAPFVYILAAAGLLQGALILYVQCAAAVVFSFGAVLCGTDGGKISAGCDQSAGDAVYLYRSYGTCNDPCDRADLGSGRRRYCVWL